MTEPARKRGIMATLLGSIGLQKKTGFGTMADPTFELLQLLSGSIEPTIAGITVGPESAMTCAPVRCAVLSISETVASLPLEIFNSGEDGTKTPNTDHPAYKLLGARGNPNPWTPSSVLIEQVCRDALLRRWGGFAEIVRVNGKPKELHRLDQEFVEVEPRHIDGEAEPTYFVSSKAGSRMVASGDMIHVRSPSQWGLLHDARNAIALALVLERHGLTLFGRGARPGGVLSFPTKLDAATSLRMKQSWQSAHGGSHNGGGTAILEEGAKWQPLAFTSTDAQYIDLRKFAVDEIARHFRVPPTFLYDFGRATFSNAEGMESMFLQYTIVPWLLRFEQEIALKLFNDDERANLIASFNTNSLARADFLARMQGYSTAVASRILNPNECRAWENLAPYKNGDHYGNPNIDPMPPSEPSQ